MFYINTACNAQNNILRIIPPVNVFHRSLATGTAPQFVNAVSAWNAVFFY